MTPVQMKLRPSQREAVRVANGANPAHEYAAAIAQIVAVTIPALSLFAIIVRGCW